MPRATLRLQYRPASSRTQSRMLTLEIQHAAPRGAVRVHWAGWAVARGIRAIRAGAESPGCGLPCGWDCEVGWAGGG